jgi:hypothetical protein
VLPQRPFTSSKLLLLAFPNSVTPLNFVRSTILRIWGVVQVERRHMGHARQVERQLCREWQRQDVHPYVSLGALQTPTVDKASILQWLDAQRQPSQQCPGLRRRLWLGIKRPLVKELRHPLADLDRIRSSERR